MVTVGIILGYLHGLQLFKPCFLGNLVLTLVGIVLKMSNVRDVPDIPNLISQMPDISEKDVECYGWTCMSKMRVAINSRSAYIQSHIG